MATAGGGGLGEAQERAQWGWLRCPGGFFLGGAKVAGGQPRSRSPEMRKEEGTPTSLRACHHSRPRGCRHSHPPHSQGATRLQMQSAVRFRKMCWLAWDRTAGNRYHGLR